MLSLEPGAETQRLNESTEPKLLIKIGLSAGSGKLGCRSHWGSGTVPEPLEKAGRDNRQDDNMKATACPLEASHGWTGGRGCNLAQKGLLWVFWPAWPAPGCNTRAPRAEFDDCFLLPASDASSEDSPPEAHCSAPMAYAT